MSLPLRAIESGAKDNGGLPGLLDDAAAGGTPAGPGRSNAPWPIAAISNGITTKTNQPRKAQRAPVGDRGPPRVGRSRAAWPKRARKPTLPPPRCTCRDACVLRAIRSLPTRPCDTACVGHTGAMGGWQETDRQRDPGAHSQPGCRGERPSGTAAAPRHQRVRGARPAAPGRGRTRPVLGPTASAARALRETGGDPREAAVRPPDQVEGYLRLEMSVDDAARLWT